MKRFGKTSKKEVDALKFLSLSNTTDELRVYLHKISSMV